MTVTINGTTGIITPDIEVDGTTLTVDAVNNRIGIGQSTPTKKLEVGGGAVSFSPDVAGKHTHEFTTNAANDARYFLRSNTTTKVDIQANGVTYFNGGKVGINETSPSARLDVKGTVSAGAGSNEDLQQWNIGSNNVKTEIKYIDADADRGMLFGTSTAHILAFQTNNTERLRISSAGLVGVNTDSPGRQLTVSGGSAEGVIQITNNTSGAAAGNGFELLHFTSGETQLLNRENGAMRFDTNGTERLRIDSAGNIATNGRNPSSYNNPTFLISGDNATLTIMGDGSNNNSSIAAIKFRVAGSSTGDYTKAAIFAKRMGGYNDLDMIFALDTAADANGVNLTNEKLRITSAGKLLIGSDTGSVHGDRLLQVGKTDRSSTYVSITSSTSGVGGLLFADTTTNDNGGYRGIIDYPHSMDAMRFYTQATERFSIRSNGDLILGPYDAPGSYTSSAKNVPYQIKVAPYGWQHHSEIAAISMGSHVGTGQDDGEIVFKTAQNVHSSTAGLQERMRITSDGRVNIGANFVQTSYTAQVTRIGGNTDVMQIKGNTSNSFIRFTDTNASSDYSLGADDAQNNGFILYDRNANAYRLVVTNAGRVGVNDDTNGWAENFQVTANTSHNQYGIAIKIQNNSGYLMRFATGNAAPCGSISGGSGNSTSFNTSWSDSRRKKNFETWNEEVLPYFKSLEPKKFNFTQEDDGTVKTKGYVAQDNVDKFPGAYPSLDDSEVDEKRYMFNPSGMVIYLMKALQEEIAKRESLESRITALES
jgi:hypothetical protein